MMAFRLNRALLSAAVFTTVGQCVFAQTQSPAGAPSTRTTTPSAQPATNGNRPARPVALTAPPKPPQNSRFSSLSDVPYMVGDTPSGGGGVFQLGGFPDTNVGPNGPQQTGLPRTKLLDAWFVSLEAGSTGSTSVN